MKITLTLNDGVSLYVSNISTDHYSALLAAMAQQDGAIDIGGSHGIQRIPVEDIKGLEIHER